VGFRASRFAQASTPRVERERRFLLARPPELSAVTTTRVITDRYVVGTRLRLRRADFTDDRCELKLTR